MADNPQFSSAVNVDAQGVNSVAFSPDGRMFASGGDDNAVSLWNVATGESLGKPLSGLVGTIEGVAFSPDGRLLAAANGVGQ